MQTYSVYDYPTKVYRYYEAPLGKLPASGFFRAPVALGGVVISESVAAVLPAGAVAVGMGSRAKGLIATRRSSATALGDLAPSEQQLTLGLVAVGVLAAWGLWKIVAGGMERGRPSADQGWLTS